MSASTRVATTTAEPVSAAPSISRRRNSRLASGSSRASGSSSSSSAGRLPSASASASCARSPGESAETRVFGEERESSSKRERVIPARVRDASEIEHVADAEPAVERGALGDVADVGERAGSRRGSRPEIVTPPSLGSSRPTARPSSVDLPAPFGPGDADDRLLGNLSVQSRSAHAPR